MHRPVASILIAAYNCSDTLEAAVKSALLQSEWNIEVIVVNDASTDKTLDVAARLAQTDSRIVLCTHVYNQGAGAARNTAIAAARGTWLVVLDADDTLAPVRVRTLIAEAKGHACDLMGDNLEIIEAETGLSLGPAFPCFWVGPGKVSLADMLARDQAPHGVDMEFGFVKPIIRRQFLLDHGIAYQTDVRVGEDFLLYAECLLAGAHFRMMPDAFYRYTVNARSLSYAPQSLSDLAEGAKRLRALSVHDPSLVRLLDGRIRRLAFAAMRNALRDRDYATAQRALRDLPPAYLAGRASLAAWRRARGSVPSTPNHNRRPI